MASTTAVSLGTLLDEALDLLYVPTERPRQYTVGSTALAMDADVNITLTGVDANVQAPTLVEHGQELMLVTDRSADATPVFTVARGYSGTPVSAAPAGTVVLVNPRWQRYIVRRQVIRALQGAIFTQLPAVLNTTVTPTQGQYFVAVPATTLRVTRVSYTLMSTAGASPTLAWHPFDGWEFVDDVPTSVVTTGKMITIPPELACSWATPPTLYVTYEAPYVWSGGHAESSVYPAESETVNLPAGAEDLPALYVAAYLVLGREITRTQMDRVQEWNQLEGDVRGTTNLRLANALWQRFYDRLGQAQKLQTVPRHRQYRPMRRI